MPLQIEQKLSEMMTPSAILSAKKAVNVRTAWIVNMLASGSFVCGGDSRKWHVRSERSCTARVRVFPLRM